MLKILVVIYHSLAELDVVLPIFTELKSKYKKIEITMIVTNETLYNNIMNNDIFSKAIKYNNIKTIKAFRRTLFSHAYGRRNVFARVINRVFSFLQEPYFLIRYIKPLIYANIYMHEYTKNMYQVYMLYIAQKLDKSKRIFIYNHAASLNFTSNVTSKVSSMGSTTLLSFHSDSNNTMMEMGYEKIYVIGHPKFYPAWGDFIKSLIDLSNEKYILIYSRNIHSDCMDHEIYVKLHITTYNTIRKMYGNKKIIIKPHPKEDINALNSIIQKNKMRNVEISYAQSMYLGCMAELVIVFYSSTILDSLSLDVPSVEYYIESKNFRNIEPEGSIYKNLGIDSVSDQKGLEEFIQEVQSGKYEIPIIVQHLKNKVDLDIFDYQIGER